MEANPILLQKKYARVVALFAEKMGISTRDALKMRGVIIMAASFYLERL